MDEVDENEAEWQKEMESLHGQEWHEKLAILRVARTVRI